jgi:voltage-gated potassium channel
MNEPLNDAAADEPRRAYEDQLAGPMFFLALAFLVVFAGVIHRFPRLDPGDLEASLMLEGLFLLWLLFILEAVFRFRLRDPGRPAWEGLTRAAAIALLPPLRLGCRSQVRPNHIWLPTLGWQPIDARLRRRLEHFFSIPMIGFALLVLPLLIVEHYWAAEIHAEPHLAFWLDIGTSIIWLGFTLELLVMVAVSDRPVRYCFSHWIDVAIVLLPLVEMLPLFRLLRVGRVLRLEQLLSWGRLHRLRTVGTRGWRAVLLLGVVQRLLRRTPEHQLRQLREVLRAKEEELADLRREITELEGRLARPAAGGPQGASPPLEPEAARACP